MPSTIDVDSIPDFQKNALADMALEITRAASKSPAWKNAISNGSPAIWSGSGSAKQKEGDETDKHNKTGPLRWHGNSPRHKDPLRS